MKKHSENKVGGRKAATAALKRMLEGTGDELDHLTKYAVRLCGDEQEASELVQEACYRALKGADRFDPSRPIGAWLTTLLHNAFVDRRRLKSWKLTDSLDMAAGEGLSAGDLLPDSQPGIEAELVRREEAAQVRRGLDALAADHRTVLRLCDMAGLTYEAAAARLGVPMGTLRSRLSRARAALRRKLGGRR